MSLGLALKLANATLSKGVGFSLPAFMAGQSDGLWYDFSKTDRLFQENTGPTPAAAANDVIGLALSQRLWNGRTRAQVVAAATEIIVNGDFASGVASWASNGGATLAGSSGTMVVTVGAGGGAATQGIPTVVGRTYAVSSTYTVGTSPSAFLRVGNSAGAFSLVSKAMAAGINTAYFVAAATTTFVSLGSSAAGTVIVDDVTVKDISSIAATQSTAGFKPKYQTAGAAFDATDDNLLTAYVAQNGANFIVAYLDVPATLAATQVICGASGSAANRCFLAFNTSGQLCGGVGSDSTSTILGTTDWRGQTVVVALSFDGTTVKLYAGTAQEYSAAQNSTPTVAIPFRLGSLNNNGTAGSFSGSAIKTILVGRQALTLGQFLSIRSQLLAGA